MPCDDRRQDSVIIILSVKSDQKIQKILIGNQMQTSLSAMQMLTTNSGGMTKACPGLSPVKLTIYLINNLDFWQTHANDIETKVIVMKLVFLHLISMPPSHI